MTHQTSKIPPQRLYSLIEQLTTEETDIAKVLVPDGNNGVEWGAAPVVLNGEVIVTQANFETTLGGVIDSTKQYVIDGEIDTGSTTINVPTTGLYLAGLTAGVSKLFSSENSYTMFFSAACGTFSHECLTLSVTGTSSQLYDLTANTGFESFVSEKLFYSNCTSLGELNGFNQGLGTNITIFGGSPSLTFSGNWGSGFRISPSLVRSLDAGMTEPILKAGAGFVMNSRFILDMNCDLPALAPFCDFSPSNFVNPSSLIFAGILLTRDGVINPVDTNLTPNVSASDLVCAWRGNQGLPNTFVGAESELTTETQTVINTQNVSEVLLGTWTESDLQHFDSPSNGQLRHIGIAPIEFSVSWDFVIDGNPNQEYRIDLIKDRGGVETTVHSQIRVINNLQGGRDVAYFTGTHHENLQQNDFTYWKIANLTGTQNCTIELGSTWDVDER